MSEYEKTLERVGVNRKRIYGISFLLAIFAFAMWRLYTANVKLSNQIRTVEQQQTKINNRLGIDNYYVRESDIVNSRNLKEILRKVK